MANKNTSVFFENKLQKVIFYGVLWAFIIMTVVSWFTAPTPSH